MLQMAGVFAEFQARDDPRASSCRAGKGQGFRGKVGRPTIPADKAAAIVADLKAGLGVVKLAKVHDVGVGTVRKLKAKLAT